MNAIERMQNFEDDEEYRKAGNENCCARYIFSIKGKCFKKTFFFHEMIKIFTNSLVAALKVSLTSDEETFKNCLDDCFKFQPNVPETRAKSFSANMKRFGNRLRKKLKRFWSKQIRQIGDKKKKKEKKVYITPFKDVLDEYEDYCWERQLPSSLGKDEIREILLFEYDCFLETYRHFEIPQLQWSFDTKDTSETLKMFKRMIQKRQNEDLFTVNGDEINLELDILTLFINTYCVWNLDGRNTLNENSFHLQYRKEEAVNVYDDDDDLTLTRRQTSSSQMELSVEERLKSTFFVTRFEAWIEKNEIPLEFADCSIEGLSRLNIGVNITMVTNVLGIRKRLKSKIHDTEFLEIACQTKGKSKKRRNYATRLKRYLHRVILISVQVFLDILFINVIPLGFFILLGKHTWIGLDYLVVRTF